MDAVNLERSQGGEGPPASRSPQGSHAGGGGLWHGAVSPSMSRLATFSVTATRNGCLLAWKGE